MTSEAVQAASPSEIHTSAINKHQALAPLPVVAFPVVVVAFWDLALPSSSSSILGPGTLMATDGRGSGARGWDNQMRKRIKKPERRDVGNKGVPEGLNQVLLALPATTCAPVSASRTTKPRTKTKTKTKKLLNLTPYSCTTTRQRS